MLFNFLLKTPVAEKYSLNKISRLGVKIITATFVTQAAQFRTNTVIELYKKPKKAFLNIIQIRITLNGNKIKILHNVQGGKRLEFLEQLYIPKVVNRLQ